MTTAELLDRMALLLSSEALCPRVSPDIPWSVQIASRCHQRWIAQGGDECNGGRAFWEGVVSFYLGEA